MERKVSERMVVFLVGAVQFVNVLDFVMVMPMGRDFSLALGIPGSEVGKVAGAYTLAAALSGLAGSFFLDRFDRRKALLVSMVGLVAGTAAGGLATGLPSMIAARVLAGVFGGPATSVSMSIIADVVPAERRGKALGAVMGAFAVASVLGVPLALKVSEWVDWRAPFLGVAGMGLAISMGAVFLLPPLTGHLAAVRAQAGHRLQAMRGLFTRPLILISYTMTAFVMLGGFLIIPNIPSYLMENLRYPRSQYGWLYFFGGIVSFTFTRVGGYLVDRYGSFRVGSFGAAVLTVFVYIGFVNYTGFPVVGIFMGFMFANAFRMVSYNTLTNKVPGPSERAQFMSLQSCVQHLASSIGAILSSHLLSEAADKQLIGMDRVATISLCFTVTLPLFLGLVESRVRRRDAAALAAQEPPAGLKAA